MPLISDLSRLRVPVKALDTNGRNRPPICARFLLGRTCDKALTVCDICAPRPSALSRKTAELAGQIALSVTSEVPLMLYSYPVPPYVLRMGNSLVAKYGFVSKGPNVPVAQKVGRCAFGSRGTAKMFSFPAGFEFSPHCAENLYCPVPLSKAGSTSLAWVGESGHSSFVKA